MTSGDAVTAAELDISDAYIPIVLGVVGHREIAKHSEQQLHVLEEAVEDIFDEFRHRHPGPTPLRLLSCLAPGADQLVAQVAKRCGVEVVAPLPFPPDVYANSSTFQDYEKERAIFLEWLPQIKWFVVPYRGADASDSRWKEIAAQQKSRRECYANAGTYIAGHCQALIAIWDGQQAPKPSGTVEFVICKRDGVLPECYPDPQPLQMGGDEGPVYIITWPRNQEDAASIEVAPVRVEVPGSTDLEVSFDERKRRSTKWRRVRRRFISLITFGLYHPLPAIITWREFEDGCQAIQDFNEDVARRSDKTDEEIRNRIIKRDESEVWSAISSLHSFLDRLSKLRETAATLAVQLDRFFNIARLCFFLSLFLAAASLHLRPELSERREAMLLRVSSGMPWTFVVFLFLAALIVLGGLYSRLYERRLDYRAFGEALRVRLMWAAAGIKESVAEHYLGQMRGEVSWARRALLALAPPPGIWPGKFEAIGNQEAVQLLGHIKEEWISSQCEFYEAASRKNQKWANFYTRMGFAGGVLGTLGVVAGLGMFGVDIESLRAAGLTFSAAAIFLTALFVIWGEDSDRPLASWIGMSAAIVGSIGFLTLALGVGAILHVANRLTIESGITFFTMLVSAILILLGGFFFAYREQTSCKELSNLYEHMHVIFCRGAQEIGSLLKKNQEFEAMDASAAANTAVPRSTTGDVVVAPERASEIIASIQKVLVALGTEALTENAQWLIMRRARPLELRPP